jgi:hypothetical protein
VINSPEVHLVIKISHAEVEHKNLFIFSYKNQADSSKIQNKSYQMISSVPLCNIWCGA